MIQNVAKRIASIGADPNDTEDTRLQKSILVYSSLMMASMAIGWASIYFAFREYMAGGIPFSYAILSFLSIGRFARTRQYAFFRGSQLLLPLLLPFFLLLSLGGFENSSAVILWSLSSPLGALLFAGRRQAKGWFLAYLVLVVIAALLEPFGRPSTLPPALLTAFYVMNIGCVSIFTFVLLQYFLGQKEATLRLLHLEQEKSEHLLLNILPAEIAARLKNKERVIADRFDDTSIMFVDMVNFTPMSANMKPEEMVGLLNEVFCYFDTLTAKYGLEKINTIGDCYMVAAGVPRLRSDHAHVLAYMALEMRDYIKCTKFGGRQLIFRTGINSGPVVAGVIGQTKFAYDLWGDTVNTASRMESHGAAGFIQITERTFELIKDDFICEPRGSLNVKGKGDMNVWYVLEKKT
jgi:adenylate cyclase